MADPKNTMTPTDYYYTDAYSSSSTCGSPPGSTNTYLTKITDAAGFTQTFSNCYVDGQLQTSTDRNSNTTTYYYGENKPS